MKTIRQLREAHGLSQEQVAAQLGCTQHAVSSWELGRSEPKARQVRALARLFTVSMDDIAFEAEAARQTGATDRGASR
jgi:transcriptional regulator with XRE-family HTH domain